MKRNVPALLALIVLTATPCWAAETNAAPPVAEQTVKDNEEAARLCSEDQSDRLSKDGTPLDWKDIKEVVVPRDRARRQRIMELYTAGELKTAADFIHAATVFQHGEKPEDYLLSHELCVTVVFMSTGNEEGVSRTKPPPTAGTTTNWISLAKQLAALSEDRFLLSVKRPQRFGTQRDWAGHLAKMEKGVTDQVRKIWNVPPLGNNK